VLVVIGHLDFAASVRLVNGLPHRVRHMIGVHHHLAADVPRSPPDRLNERVAGAEESLLVCIQDRHERHLREIQTFPQQVHPHDDVVYPGAQVVQDVHPLQSHDLGVQIVYTEPRLAQVLGEILGHALRERRHQGAFASRRTLAQHADQVIDLPAGGAHDDLRIDEAGGADDLLDDLRAHGAFIVGRRRRDEHALRDVVFELAEGQRPVVQR